MRHRATGYGRGEVGADRDDKVQVCAAELEASEEGAEGIYRLRDGDGFAEAAARVRAVKKVLQLTDLLQWGPSKPPEGATGGPGLVVDPM
ncbi:hypothetical protein PAPYR_1698 [Paratrimastix pyriformis]|uniref:Uncharacterized protein n=1 Tax=Paratrimastix pyriformis TaxID=342808 RepID=A0ABQ8UU81_9EUKA|nr:hypothetical protein PAPYR_1698 [Paratrimastix pyriformis]